MRQAWRSACRHARAGPLSFEDKVTAGGNWGIVAAMPTRPKALPEAEVFATHARVGEAFNAEVASTVVPPEGEFPVDDGKPDTRANVLLGIWGRILPLCERLKRAHHREAQGAGLDLLLDHTDRERASVALKTALDSIEEVVRVFEAHSANAQWGVHPLHGAVALDEDATGNSSGMQLGASPNQRAARLKTMAIEIDSIRLATGFTEYAKETSTADTWDELLSDFAVEMHDVGFSDARISEILLNVTDAEGAASISQRRRRRRLASRQATLGVPEA